MADATRALGPRRKLPTAGMPGDRGGAVFRVQGNTMFKTKTTRARRVGGQGNDLATESTPVATLFADWADRGFAAEIIPVIPPGAKAKLHGAFCIGDGKTPGSRVGFSRDADGEIETIKFVATTYYGHANWRSDVIHPVAIHYWDRYGMPSNVGLRTAQFPALDVDVKHDDDLNLADAIERLTMQMIGRTAVRYRDNSPSRAVAFRLDGAPFGKGSRAFITPSGHEAKVEMLAAGQQYVVAGMHLSGAELRWRPRLPVASKLATVSQEQANALLDAIYMLVLECGGKPPLKKAASGNCGASADTTPDWIVQRLRAEGFVDPAKPMVDGRWKAQLTCPWEGEHGERPETGTVYFVGGGFRCQHNSCAERHWPDVEDFLRQLGWPVDQMQVRLWNARQRSTNARTLETISALTARLGGAK
jgi:hypothetical protein